MVLPLVTCAVTSFNAEETIGRAVNSALAQAYRPLEVVVVDDASTDASADIVSRVAARHREVRLVRQDANKGVAACRNRAVQEARGEFVAFFDDDDRSLPQRLTKQLSRILDYERAYSDGAPVICHSARLIEYPDGRAMIWRALGEQQGCKAPTGPDVALAILGAGAPLRRSQSGATATCSQMARRSVYELVGGFDAQFRRSEDCDFAVRASLLGAHFIGVAAPLVRQTLTGSTDKSVQELTFYGRRLLDKHKGFLIETGMHDLAYHYCEARFAFMAGRNLSCIAHLASAFLSHPLATMNRLAAATGTMGLTKGMNRLYRGIGR